MSKKIFGAVVLIQLSLLSTAHATDYEYPELVVTPRATERLRLEAAKEPQRKWTTQIPLQISSGLTFIAAVAHKDRDGTNASNARLGGLIIGGGWLLASFGLEAWYTPYQSAYKEIESQPHGTQRENLTRERLAEESIDGAASLGKSLMWASFASNLAVSAFMFTKAQSGSVAWVFDGVAALAAFTPLVFQYHWSTVASDQHEYKKKIYGPITEIQASPTVVADSNTGRVSPGLGLALQF